MLKFTTVCNLSSLRENWGTVGFMKIPEPKKVKYILVVRQIRERGEGFGDHYAKIPFFKKPLKIFKILSQNIEEEKNIEKKSK